MDVVQIHDIVCPTLQSWSGASAADPHESDGDREVRIAIPSDTDWAGEASALHSHVRDATPQ